MTDITDFIPGIDIDWTGGACPFQAQGRINDHAFYYRERSGEATLQVALEPDTDGDEMWDRCWNAAARTPEFRECGDKTDGPWLDTLINLIARLECDPRPIWNVRYMSPRIDDITGMTWADERAEALADEPELLDRILSRTPGIIVHADSADEAVAEARVQLGDVNRHAWLARFGWNENRIEQFYTVQASGPMKATMMLEGIETSASCPAVVITSNLEIGTWGPNQNWLLTPFAADPETDEIEWAHDAWIERHNALKNMVQTVQRNNKRADSLAMGGKRRWDEISAADDPFGITTIVTEARTLAGQTRAVPMLDEKDLVRQLRLLASMAKDDDKGMNIYHLTEVMLALLGDVRPK